MLASEKIGKAFLAIVEEAEKIQQTASDGQQDGLKKIISIAKHQSDIRDVKSGKCAAHSRCIK